MRADLHAQLAAVMEAFVHAAVAELHKQQEGGSGPPVDLRPGDQLLRADSVRKESRERLVCFAAILETLANEALGKIVNIVDDVKPRRDGEGAHGGETAQIAIVSVLNNACVEAEHSYGVPPPNRHLPALAQDQGLGATLPASWNELAADGTTQKPEVRVRRRKSLSSPSQSARRHQLGQESANVKPFACEVCGRCFTLRQNLRRHTRGHMGIKKFCCGVCGKGFTRAVALRTHELIHTGQKPLKCEQCPKSFRHAANLKNHLRVHSGARPFTCDVCGKTFRQAVNLKIHRRVHTGERPYACRQCGKTFSQQSSLITHGRTHSDERPFVCTSCLKTFNNANSLKLHVRVHTGERPYTCDICAKTFTQGSHLRTHKTHVHDGGKRFICDKCGKGYANGRNLKTHKCGYS
ncbi:gastrula zinc finger protein XlCGF52.1 isoform X2 [Hippocampus comes]|uniref:gastrula zinc finger protein XlCGF52.1 isoform X2 n=1 Tax=Hippocampus comes TaxID=109280 RepID=UPI00094E52D6|nr:PREDICTED: gastrula zinc finger protein XlCGF52.1-like isoform X2 [Hippocampus comes]